MTEFRELTVARVEPQTREAVAVTFDVPDELAGEFEYQPGQHLTVRAELDGETLRRSYSICAAPQDRQLRIAIKRVADGRFSNWANDNLLPGSRLQVMPPSGQFGPDMDADHARHYLALAAGSGITPILSIIKTVLQSQPESRFTLVYGNRSANSVLFKEELEDLKDRFMTRFSLVFVLSREELDVDLFHGRLDEARVSALLDQWIDPADIDEAFVCGPLDMMEGAKAALLSKGVAEDRIRLELFATSAQEAAARQNNAGQAAQRAIDGGCEVSVVLDGRTREFVYEGGDLSLLDAAAEQGIDLPFSCKAGVCSTCRCKVTSGEVDMNACYALEDYEIERGFALACQSFPQSEKVTLDFDQET